MKDDSKMKEVGVDWSGVLILELDNNSLCEDEREMKLETVNQLFELIVKIEKTKIKECHSSDQLKYHQQASAGWAGIIFHQTKYE